MAEAVQQQKFGVACLPSMMTVFVGGERVVCGRWVQTLEGDERLAVEKSSFDLAAARYG